MFVLLMDEISSTSKEVTRFSTRHFQRFFVKYGRNNLKVVHAYGN